MLQVAVSLVPGPGLLQGEGLPILEQAIGLAVALLAGAAIGLEREIRDKSAGLRTHSLVALGAAIFLIVARQLILAAEGNIDAIELDILRAVAGVIGGIGFLGAGAIIQDRGGVSGLTTAASIWVSAAVGTASGAGHYSTVLLALVLALLVLVPIRKLESLLLKQRQDSSE